MIELRLNPKVESFRAEFQQWLASNPPPVLPAHASLDEYVAVSSRWQEKLARDRFVGVHFPEQYGGRGLSIVEEAVLQEELAKANSPQLVGIFGLTMVGPVLMKHGSDEQKRRYLPKILSAEELWCQGFSEPEAGSDLASLKTTAELRDGQWVVNGQKVWTSFAQYSTWCFLLTRTDPTAPKHKGLTYLFMAMDTPGVDRRPLTQITGEQEFNELFLDGVQIPAQNIVGLPGQGWEIAISTLMYERVALTFSRHLQSENAIREIASLLKSRVTTAAEQTAFGRLLAKNMAVRTLALSHLVTYNESNTPGPEGSMDKLFWSESFQELGKFGMELLGEDAALPSAFLDGAFQHRYLYSRGRTIAAGTSEIQRGIIAERVMGLPRK